jgi:hypothetical protein
MWTFHVQNCFFIILINMGYHKFNHHHAKHALENEYVNFRFKITKKIHIIIKNSKENFIYTYIDTEHRKLSGFITITIQFHKISHCNAEHDVVARLYRVYVHNQKFKVMLFLK